MCDLLRTLYNGIAAFMIKTAVLVFVFVFVLVLVLIHMSIIIVLEWRVQYRDGTALFFLFFFLLLLLELFETPNSIGLIFLLNFITTLILNIKHFHNWATNLQLLSVNLSLYGHNLN